VTQSECSLHEFWKEYIMLKYEAICDICHPTQAADCGCTSASMRQWDSLALAGGKYLTWGDDIACAFVSERVA